MATLVTAATKYGATEWEINPALLLLKNPNTNETITDWLTKSSADGGLDYTLVKNKVSWANATVSVPAP